VRVSRHRLSETESCDVLVTDDRPLVAAALAAALDHVGLRVAVCERLDSIGDRLLLQRPQVLVLSGGSTRRAMTQVPVLKAASQDLAVVAVLEADHLVTAQDQCADVLLGPDTGVDQLARAILRARAGERYAAGLVRGRRERRPKTSDLTEREAQVLRMMARGAANDAIAESLGISVNTVRTHVQSILRKLGEGRRVAAVRRASELGLLDKRPV
jgi:DNA-binding NarL/FixJ family response regulator